MKVPLRFQNTEYDCGTTSYVNALAYLFDREEIPVELLKSIYKYTLDAEGDNHIPGEKGTSKEAARKLTKYFIDYSNSNDFGLRCKVISGMDVNKDNLMKLLEGNTVAIARCYQIEEHYVLITKMDDIFTYIFDPYYLEEQHYVNDEDVAIVTNQIFTHNRVVKTDRLFSNSRLDFSLMEESNREVIIISRD